MRVRLDIPLYLYEVANATGGRLFAKGDTIIRYISTDSRELAEGDLFFALRGERYDGHDYIERALAIGAFVISEGVCERAVCVRDTAEALLALAAYYKSRLTSLIHTVAITGSVGKTTTKNFLAEMLSRAFIIHATEGNFNNIIGASLTLLSAPKDTECLVVELGMNARGEIEALSRAIRPTLSIITNVGTAHIGRLGSREQIALAKSEIVLGMSEVRVICPQDEPFLAPLTPKVTFSADNPDADYLMYDVHSESTSSSFMLRARNKQPIKYHTLITGEHNLLCLLAAISAASELDLPPHKIREGVLSITPSHTRLKRIELSDMTLLDDSYNSSLEALSAMLRYLSRFPSPRAALLGDILELGAKTEEIHTQAGMNASRCGLSHLYLYGVYSPFVRNGALLGGIASERIFLNNDTSRPDITAEQIRINHSPREIILCKASHSLRLSQITEILIREEKS